MATNRAITLVTFFLSLFLSGILAEALQAEKTVQKEAGHIPIPKQRLPTPPPSSARMYVVRSRPAPKAQPAQSQPAPKAQPAQSQPARKLQQGGSKTVDCSDHLCAVIWLGRKALVMKMKLPQESS